MEGLCFCVAACFAAYSVSASNKNTVARYIQTQDLHHRKMTFEDEFITLLKKHGVEYDPKYVFGWIVSRFSALISQTLNLTKNVLL